MFGVFYWRKCALPDDCDVFVIPEKASAAVSNKRNTSEWTHSLSASINIMH